MNIRQLDQTGRWWRVNDRDIDLSSTEYVGYLRAAALAHRDAIDDDDRNVAALLEAIVDGDLDAADGRNAVIVAGWLFTHTQGLVDRIDARIQRLKGLTA